MGDVLRLRFDVLEAQAGRIALGRTFGERGSIINRYDGGLGDAVYVGEKKKMEGKEKKEVKDIVKRIEGLMVLGGVVGR